MKLEDILPEARKGRRASFVDENGLRSLWLPLSDFLDYGSSEYLLTDDLELEPLPGEDRIDTSSSKIVLSVPELDRRFQAACAILPSLIIISKDNQYKTFEDSYRDAWRMADEFLNEEKHI